MNHPTEKPTHRDLGADLPAVTEDQRHIGVAIPREGVRRLTQGRGQFVDDIDLPRLAHVVFWRSPVAHMRITRIERSAAQELPGVIAVVTGPEIAAVCKPWVATLAHLAGIKSAPQYPLAIDRATWQGEPVWPWSPKRAPAPRTRWPCCRWNGKTCPRCWTPRPRCTPTRR